MGGAFQKIIAGLQQDLKTLNSAKITNYLRNLPAIIRNVQKPAQYGYYAIIAGVFLILLQIILWIF